MMRYEPHEYQSYATEYIKDHDIAAVLLECGLGKTSITLTAISDLMFDSFDIHKVLVIAPIRVAKMMNRLVGENKVWVIAAAWVMVPPVFAMAAPAAGWVEMDRGMEPEKPACHHTNPA